MSDGSGPTLVMVVGPGAVGKMAVGQEIAVRTGLRLFHNHVAIEPVLRFFDFEHPSFARLVDDFRRGVFREVANSDLPGLVFTLVWAFDLPEDEETVEGYARPFRERGGRVLFVELEADLKERLRRNVSEFRLAEKASKRDIEKSRRVLLEIESKYQLNSDGRFDGREDWLRIDNTHLGPAEVAEMVIEHFGLERLEAAP